MIYGSGSLDDSDDGPPGVARKCPHCQKRIRWKDYTGLATQSWHYTDMIVAQAVVTDSGEEIDTGLFPSEQKCGHCREALTEAMFS